MLGKLLKKILISFLLFVILGLFSVSADLDPYVIIEELTTQLEETTELLIEISDDNNKLTIENKDLKKENEKIRSKDENVGRILELETTLEATTNQLVESNVFIENLIQRIEDDQIEIENLRNTLNDCVAQLDEEKFFGANLGIIYPWGFQIAFNADIPKIPIGFHFGLGTQFKDNQLLPFLGGGLRFKF